jgi:hypothetical protein
MSTKIGGTKMRFGFRRVAAMGIAGAIAGTMTLAPLAAAGNLRDEERVTHERGVDRGEVENLQRWVSAGHADWCKDARLVAAEELWRLAPDYSGDGFELNAVSADAIADGGERVVFEWTPPDGRAIFRVTVERFAWLLPIAKKTEAIVWVPTSTEIRSHE